MKIFLTGGTGFIGKALTRSLIARGWNVVALVCKPDSAQARALTKMGAQCVAGDVTDRESMRAGMTGKFFKDGKAIESKPYSHDKNAQRRLRDVSNLRRNPPCVNQKRMDN